MKNFTIKKVALGLFLAGYAASSAFALDAAYTKHAIEGNAPVLYSRPDSITPQSLNVKFASDDKGQNLLGKDDKINVGNYMVISYDLRDEDGDEDTGQILDSLTLSVNVGDNLKDYSKDDLETSREKGKIVIKLDDKFAGATRIGFTLQEKTEFGLPNVGKWIRVGNIWNAQKPESNEEKDKLTPPGKNNPTGPSPDDEDLPVVPGPIISPDFKLAIYKVGDNGVPGNIDYSIVESDDTIPRYGEKFVVKVLNNNGDDFTSSFKFEWKLKGKYGGVDAQDDEVLTEGTTIVLGAEKDNDGKWKQTHNSMYDSVYKAGAQGYNLQVNTK
ncbi:hypothetical protein [Gilliamella sp. Imp1-1]|nr:hypothetical protein [Gilliamella apicola]KDN11033.1 hypothetical protein GAPWKB30_0406 [Gilliamella apicola]OCG55805.1 hypothetical protein A9G38_11110 [Gilliamella apicola]